MTFLVLCLKGVNQAFRWVYIPVLILAPASVELNTVGLPDLTPQRAAAAVLAAGVLLTGAASRSKVRWHWIDLLALVPVISFSISYANIHGPKAFPNSLYRLTLDWACPYLLFRILCADLRSLLPALRMVAICAAILACLSIYECRMATRLTANLWSYLGIELRVLPHLGGWRWGFLRAAASFTGPICLGVFFATVTPLAILWGTLDRARRTPAIIAAVLCGLGCLSTLSRGPFLVLCIVLFGVWLISLRARVLPMLVFVVMLSAAPFLMEAGQESITHTRQRLAETGNTADESGHYRIALLLVYAVEIAEVGWFGDVALVASKYPDVWSIDNAYLYLFLLGGWIGGGAFALIVILLLYRGARYIFRRSGRERKVALLTLAAFAAATGSMADVWFAPDYAPFFWITAALALNISTARTSLIPVRPLETAQTRKAPW